MRHGLFPQEVTDRPQTEEALVLVSVAPAILKQQPALTTLSKYLSTG